MTPASDLMIPHVKFDPDTSGTIFFGNMGPLFVRTGWSVFPQTHRDRRGPGIVDGHALRWKEYSDRLPTDDEVRWWAIQCPKHNVAAIMGKASGNVFGLDIDVDDVDLSMRLMDLADRMLGPSAFRRIGQYPRVVLLYRYADDDIIPSRSWRFVPGEPDANGNPVHFGGLELLSHGKPVTFYGHHHKTGRGFTWSGLSPLYNAPSKAPLVSRAQVEAYIAAAQEIRPFARASRVSTTDTRWTYDPTAGLHAPRVLSSDEWSVDDDGLVVDGREAFLFALCRAVVRSNEAAARAGSAGISQLCALVEDRFVSLAQVSGRWTSDLKNEIADKVQSSVRYAIERSDGGQRVFRSPLSVDPETCVSVFAEDRPDTSAVAVDDAKADDLNWVTPAVKRAITDLGSKRLPPMEVIPATAATTALAAMLPREERYAAGQAVADQVSAVVGQAFDFAYAVTAAGGFKAPLAEPGQARALMPIYGLAAPTGAGKTRSVIRTAILKRAANPDVHVNTAVLVPTHANAAEICEAVPVHELELNEAIEEAEAAGLTVVHFKGRVASGCGHADQLERLYAAGQPGSRLCRTNDKNRVTEEREEKLCRFYHNCAHRLQIEKLASGTVNLTVMPHAYLTGPMAKEVSDHVHFAVVDETHWRALSNVRTFPVTALTGARALPKLDKAERSLGIDAQEFVLERDAAVRTLLDALDRGIDPARAFLALSKKTRAGWVDHGSALLTSAARCVSASQSEGLQVHPEMTDAEIDNLTAMAQGDHLDAEGALWKLVRDRLADLIAYRLENELYTAAMDNGGSLVPPVRRVVNDHDPRIQSVVATDEKTKEPGPHIRISYWRKRNFVGLPTLLIDASMSEKITRKAWPGREPIITRVNAPQHLRTILVADGTGSDSAIIPARTKGGDARFRAAARADLFHALVTRVSALYANSGVLASMTKAVRAFFEGTTCWPANVDCLHQGNTRGYNFAEHHGALVSYGRLEYPASAVDAYKALFTYDEAEPEAAWDLYGTGMTKDGKKAIEAPSDRRTILMRDGSRRQYEDVLYPEGSWSREVQIQLREEELRQTVGRLRPVYRIDSDAVWILVGRCVPEGVVVDEIVTLQDLVRPDIRFEHLFEGARRSHGVISPSNVQQRHKDIRLDDTGMCSPLKKLTPREQEGLVHVQWRNEGYPNPVPRLMLNSEPDLELAAMLHCEEQGWTMVPGTFEVIGTRPTRAPVSHKTPDRQDLDRAELTQAQAAEIVEERGTEGLRDYVRGLDREREIAKRARSLAKAIRELGHVPSREEMWALPALPGVPRSRAKATLTQRMLLDEGARIGGVEDDDDEA